MKKIRIGIPRALLYHKYGILWKTFFNQLNCQVIISPPTNKDILNLGVNNTIDECCLSYKIYTGHVLSLIDKCDYILITRICDFGKKNKVCTRYNGIYDDIKYLINQSQILEYNIEHTKFQYELLGFIKIGFKITKNPIKILKSYLIAKRKQNNYNQSKENETKNKLIKTNKKILIISHFYNIKDGFLTKDIIDYINKNNITIIYSNQLNSKTTIKFSEYFSNTLYWKYSKEMVGALYYCKNMIDGIIFISTYPCSIDTLVNNLIISKNKDLPTLNIIIDENTSFVNLETKLESYIDIIKGEYK